VVLSDDDVDEVEEEEEEELEEGEISERPARATTTAQPNTATGAAPLRDPQGASNPRLATSPMPPPSKTPGARNKGGRVQRGIAQGRQLLHQGSEVLGSALGRKRARTSSKGDYHTPAPASERFFEVHLPDGTTVTLGEGRSVDGQPTKSQAPSMYQQSLVSGSRMYVDEPTYPTGLTRFPLRQKEFIAGTLIWANYHVTSVDKKAQTAPNSQFVQSSSGKICSKRRMMCVLWCHPHNLFALACYTNKGQGFNENVALAKYHHIYLDDPYAPPPPESSDHEPLKMHIDHRCVDA